MLRTWASHGSVVVDPVFPRTNRDVTDPTAGRPDLAEQLGDHMAATVAPPVWPVTPLDGLHSPPFDDNESPYDEMVARFTTDFWGVYLRGDTNRMDVLRVAAQVDGLTTLAVRD